jgi:hypothetical protein
MSPSERRLGRIVPPPMSALQSRTSELALVVARYSADTVRSYVPFGCRSSRGSSCYTTSAVALRFGTPTHCMHQVGDNDSGMLFDTPSSVGRSGDSRYPVRNTPFPKRVLPSSDPAPESLPLLERKCELFRGMPTIECRLLYLDHIVERAAICSAPRVSATCRFAPPDGSIRV